MSYECPTTGGIIRLTRGKHRWCLEFAGSRRSKWRSPDAAVAAAARYKSGLPEWDRQQADVPDDLLDWRPLGDSL
jgi:hypothetical protein